MTLLRNVLFLSLVACALPAAAQFVDDDFRLRSVPGNVVAGEATTLVLEGAWGGCLPVGGRLAGSGLRRTIVLQAPPEGTFCPAVISQFSLQLPDLVFDEADVGTIAVAVVYTTGDLLGLSSIPVQSAAPAALSTSLYDVSGSWYSPETAGSGLILVHNKFARQDTVDGGWANFREDGGARWYALLGDGWASPTTLIGSVIKAAAEASYCKPGPSGPSCDFDPRRASETVAFGQFTLEFESANRATLTFSKFGSSGAPLQAAPIALVKIR